MRKSIILHAMLARRLARHLLQPQRSLHGASGCVWNELGLDVKVAAAARSLIGDASTPSEIQRLAVPLVLAGSHVACASETGSGKTLTFLLPLIELSVLPRRARPERSRKLRRPSSSP